MGETLPKRTKLSEYVAAKSNSQQPGNYLSRLINSIGDEAAGALARYGRRSGAQRDASLALLNQAASPDTDPFIGAGQKLLGLAGLITHPLAFFPTADEWQQETNVGPITSNFLANVPSLIDPQMAAGGAALAAAPVVGKLGRGISDLAGDATEAELSALRARLQAEAAQTGGSESGVTASQALENLVNQPQRGQLVTQSYKDTLPDGTTQWVPGTLRVNPPTSRFQPEMTPADIKRYIEEHGEAPTPRAKGELVTQSYKEVYPDGTVRFAPGTFRTKRPPSNKK